MKVLQLCCFTNQWGPDYIVDSWDLRLKKDIFDIPETYPRHFDIVACAPPCDQFSKVNAHAWEEYPERFINIARRCLDLALYTGKYWFLENPPGRIEKFIPELTKYRMITWKSPVSNKEYVLYSNFVIMQTIRPRYGKKPLKKFDNMTKKQREAWDINLIPEIKQNLKSEIFAER